MLACVFGNLHPAWRKTPPAFPRVCSQGQPPNRPARHYSDTYCKILGQILGPVDFSYPLQKPGDKRCTEKKDLPGETLEDKVFTPGAERFRLKTSVAKPIRNVSKCSQGWKTLALPNAWTGSHEVCEQPNLFHLEVRDREWTSAPRKTAQMGPSSSPKSHSQPFCCWLSSSEHWGAWEKLVWEDENTV